MFSILHCADLHLEASFASSQLPPPVGNLRRKDLRAALGRILALAREHSVDIVTIAGDLYEQEYATAETGDFLREQFASVAPIRIFIAPGECDPFTEDSLYALSPWPDNVYIFKPGPLSAQKVANNIHLWGTGYPLEAGRRSLAGFQVDRPGLNLLLLHAARTGSADPRDQAVLSIDESSVRAAGFDLALLGHLHGGHSEQGTVECSIYPGSPEPLTPVEAQGDHDAILLTFENGACIPQYFMVNQWRYTSLRVDISGCSAIEEAAGLVASSLRSQPNGVDERTICYVTLVGTRRFDIDVQSIKARVNLPAHVEFDLQLSAARDLEILASEPTIRGLMVRRFQQRIAEAADSERATAIAALNLALRALDGKQV